MLMTNPDMLHQSILPLHKQFGPLLANLKYVVVDEGHAYRSPPPPSIPLESFPQL